MPANFPMKRCIAGRSYSTSATRSRPGQKSLGCAEARSTPRTAVSASSATQAAVSSSTSASSMALPRGLSRRRTARGPCFSTRMALTGTSLGWEASLPERELLGGARRAVVVTVRIHEPVLGLQPRDHPAHPLAVAAGQVDAGLVGVAISLEVTRGL